ncbi:hypothetical protein [Paenibacillus rhizoplanae]|uniref:Uncharacterized protein n=1 Tax=Paenibacillus rhizoplanae TaxID=1917181 RepID=A0ABW5FAB4_9BACL
MEREIVNIDPYVKEMDELFNKDSSYKMILWDNVRKAVDTARELKFQEEINFIYGDGVGMAVETILLAQEEDFVNFKSEHVSFYKALNYQFKSSLLKAYGAISPLTLSNITRPYHARNYLKLTRIDGLSFDLEMNIYSIEIILAAVIKTAHEQLNSMELTEYEKDYLLTALMELNTFSQSEEA